MSHRNLEYLHRNRIVYRGYPNNDKPTESYWWGDYYEDGTHECYELFKSTAKITTYKSLKWHLLVLLYLNPNMDEKKFKNLCKFICDKSNGFITFVISDKLLNKISDEVYNTELDEAPKNKLRKIIFKPNSGIDIGKKLRIVGSLIGKNKKADKDNIYEAMMYINNIGDKITISNIANFLGCTTRTVHRNMCEELRVEKELLNSNEEVQC